MAGHVLLYVRILDWNYVRIVRTYAAAGAATAVVCLPSLFARMIPPLFSSLLSFSLSFSRSSSAQSLLSKGQASEGSKIAS